MKEILVCESLNSLQLVGKLLLTDEYYNLLSETIGETAKQGNELPEIRLNYGTKRGGNKTDVIMVSLTFREGIARTDKSKLVAIESGGDWTDACVTYFLLTDNYDVNGLELEYRKLGGWNGLKIGFIQWLIKNGYAVLAEVGKDIQILEER